MCDYDVRRGHLPTDFLMCEFKLTQQPETFHGDTSSVTYKQTIAQGVSCLETTYFAYCDILL